MKRLALLFGLLSAPFLGHAQTFSLIGDTVDAAMIMPRLGPGRVGYGLFGPFVVSNGISDLQQWEYIFSLNMEADRFDIEFLYRASFQEPIVLRISDLDFSTPGTSFLAGVGVNTSLTHYTLSHGSDWIELGLGGTSFNNGSFFTGTFNVAPVPEPSQLALMALGLGLVGALVGHRSRSAGG